MPLYMAEFSYTPEAWAALIKSPENREETVRGILEDAGSKLHNPLVHVRRDRRLRLDRSPGQHYGRSDLARGQLERRVPEVRDARADDPK